MQDAKWFEAVIKESDGKWMTQEYQDWVVENGFPGLWSQISERDKKMMISIYDEVRTQAIKDKYQSYKFKRIPEPFWESNVFSEEVINQFLIPSIFLVVGESCTGKTTLLCDLVKCLDSACYVDARDYQRWCETGVSYGDTLWEDMGRRPYALVIDNVGKETVRHGFCNFVLDTILHRIDHGLKTVFAMNTSPEGLSNYSSSIHARVKNGFISRLILEDKESVSGL
jgi:hypothetical protein